MSRALEALAAVHRDPHRPAQRHREAGGGVVACAGSDVPAELLAAAGLFAVWVTGDPSCPRDEADRYLGPSTDERSRSQLSRVLAGDFGYADQLLVCHDCEGSRRLFAGLSELRRLGLTAELPPAHLFDLLHLPYRSSQRYNQGRLAALRTLVGEWSGHAPSDDDVRAAVAAANERRRLIAKVNELRAADPPRLNGRQALQAIGAGCFLNVGEHACLLGELLDAADGLPTHAGMRVFVTGSDHDHDGLYALIEEHGAVVVGEDHPWGMPAGEGAIAETTDPLDGIAAHYQFQVVAAAKRAIAERAAATVTRATACRAQAVIGFGRRGDDAPAWDYPAQRQALAGHGIPTVFVGDVPYTAEPSPECAAAVRAFLALVRDGAAAVTG
jgi:benzoyl-CoA reductase/2-hydroxyglutaryl-CoA dehydratase subunit BcrC/BadD/HgdB